MRHVKQQQIWDQEHEFPRVLLQMDNPDPASGVVKFWRWILKQGHEKRLRGIEMGCGKGKNVIWLSQQGADMTGFDFSPHAIKVAKKRAALAHTKNNVRLLIADATSPWEFSSNAFDFAIDCFATTDIETKKGREFAISEMIRVVKPDGYILVYVMSSDDSYHKEMRKKSPAKEKNAFLHPLSGKFEKVFEREELVALYKQGKLIIEERIPKNAVFFGKKYTGLHHWMIFQKR